MGLFSLLTGKSRPPLSDGVNLASREFKANPHPYYARLRDEAPIYRKSMMIETAWLITRYDDVAMVLKDERFIKNMLNARTPEQAADQPWFRKLKVFKSLRRTMLSLDPPDHTRLRGLVSKAFTPRLIEQMRKRIEGLTDDFLDRVQAHGRMDLIRDYALPLPATIIAEMLGVPVEDRHKFHRWSNALVSPSSTWGILKAIPNALGFIRYIRGLIKQRRAKPQDDLVSALVRAEEAGDTLSEDELHGDDLPASGGRA